MSVRRLAVVFSALALMAQAPAPQQPPEIEALQQTVLKLTGEALDWQVKAIAAQRRVAELERQVAEKKPEEPKK